MLSYPVKLEGEGKFIVATSPDIPEMATQGNDEEDALQHAVDAFEEAIAARMLWGQDIPEPSRRGKVRVILPLQTELKVRLYQELRKEGLSKAELARRLGWHRNMVDKLVSLKYSNKIETFAAAFEALGVKLNIELVAA